jgi:hypothetical protein
MATLHGKNSVVLFKQFNLTGYFNSADTSATVETAESTTFGSSAKSYIVGLRDGTISLQGLFDGAADAVDEVIRGTLASETDPILTFAPKAAAIGDKCQMAAVKSVNYSISSPVADVVSITADFQCSGGLDHGVILHPLGAETGTVNSASVDNAAASTNGGVGHLHATLVDVTSATIKIQHSTDNSVWVDLITFTALSGTTETSERTAVTGTVNRYLRFQISAFTGTSATVAGAFARR